MQNKLKGLILIIVISNYFNGSVFGQDIIIAKNGEKQEIYFDRSEACDKNLVFTIVEQIPKYKGGIKQLENHLNKLISFEKKIKGEFYLRCTINCEGKVFGFQESNSKNAEVVEKIKNHLIELQNWKAGKQRGAQVDCFYSFKVRVKKGKIKLSR